MPKRPRAEASSSPASPAAIRQRLVSESQSTPITIDSLGPLAGLRVHIIDAKLSDELDEPVMLRQMAEHLGANVNSSVIDEADVIVTRITALKRLQRHIDLRKAVRFCRCILALIVHFWACPAFWNAICWFLPIEVKKCRQAGVAHPMQGDNVLSSL